MKTYITKLTIFYCILLILSCGGDDNDNTFVDDRDDQVYRTTEINGLTWMTDNMNYAGNDLGWTHLDDPSFAATYGRLYDWSMVSEVCPNSWRLPTQQESETLAQVITDDKMTLLPNELNLIAGGLRQNDQGQYDGKTEYQLFESFGFFWTSTEFIQNRLDINGEEISAHSFYYDKSKNLFGVAPSNKEIAISVRCVR